jgi:predicted nucleic acid-binding protein
MDSRYRLVTDASILFDAVKGGILHEMFQLPFIFITSDFVAYRELKTPPLSSFEKAGIRIEELSGSQIRMLEEIHISYRNLSVNDISVYILAKDLSVTLVTGDDALRRYAESSGVQVHGILWILDELVRNEIIRKTDAAIALRRMLDHGCRLPKTECDDRFSRWD